MSLLTDTDIIAKLQDPVDKDPLVIHPILDRNQIYGTKVDLRIDNELFRFKQGLKVEFDLDRKIILNECADRLIRPYGEELVVFPGELLISYTFEFVRIPTDMVGRFGARARLAKLGLITSSGIVDPGFADHLIISFFNAGKFPMILRPLMRVVSLSIQRLEKSVTTDFEKKPVIRPQLDPDNLVMNLADYDSPILASFKNIRHRKENNIGEI